MDGVAWTAVAETTISRSPASRAIRSSSSDSATADPPALDARRSRRGPTSCAVLGRMWGSDDANSDESIAGEGAHCGRTYARSAARVIRSSRRDRVLAHLPRGPTAGALKSPIRSSSRVPCWTYNASIRSVRSISLTRSSSVGIERPVVDRVSVHVPSTLCRDMRAMVLDAPGRALRAAELPVPSRAPGEVLLRVRACGVCRTDLHVVDGELPQPKLPLVLGHEIVGDGRARRQRVDARRRATGSACRGSAGRAASAASAVAAREPVRPGALHRLPAGRRLRRAARSPTRASASASRPAIRRRRPRRCSAPG